MTPNKHQMRRFFLIPLILFSVVSLTILTGFDVDNRGMVRVNHEDATAAGIFVAEGPLQLENGDGIHCLELKAYSEDYFNKEKYSYMEKPGAMRYAYVRIEDGYFEENLNEKDFFGIKCSDEGETLNAKDEDGNTLKLRVLKLSGAENLSNSGVLGRNSVFINASGYLTKFVEASDFLKESFDMGIYEFKVLSASNEEYSGRIIPVLCPKAFAEFLENNSMGLNLRGVCCYDGMEWQGNPLWSIISAETLDYDRISVETKANLMEWYGGKLSGKIDDVKNPGPVFIIGIIALLAAAEGGFLMFKKVIAKKRERDC